MTQHQQERQAIYDKRQHELEQMQSHMVTSGKKALIELRQRMQTKTNHVLEKTCGNCHDFLNCNQCGNPMVYLNHDSNIYNVRPETPACGYYFPEKSSQSHVKESE